jgi:adenylate cyclase
MNRHHSSSSLHGARQAVAWKLMLKEPSSHARYAEYQQQQIVIGRSPDSDLQLQDRFASSSHARLTFTATGLFLLTDLNSANGTYVNGKTINEVYVKAGDQVTIGRTILTICGDEPQPSSSAPDEVTSIMSRPVDAGGTLFSESLLTALNKSSKILLREGNYRESLELVLEQIRSPLEADCAFVLFKDLDQNRWSIEAQAGPMQLPKELQGDATSGSSMDIDKHRELPSLSIARTVIEAGQGYFSANVNEDEQFAKHQSVILQSINTVICVPFVLGKKNILAALYLDRRGLASQNKRPWSAGERDFVESFSRLLTLMLNHSRQQEDLQREIRTRTTLQRYISPQVVNQVLNAKHQHMLGGQEVHASVLFSDIRGFTKMSSNTDPVRLVQQLNEYFSVMSKVIIAHGGYLDKFIGDAIMVVFGVPEMKTDDKLLN